MATISHKTRRGAKINALDAVVNLAGDTMTGTLVAPQVDVDNISIDANTISSTSGNIVLSPTADALVGANRILTVGDEGTGNGLDADTVDGIEGAELLQRDGSVVMTGLLTLSADPSASLHAATKQYVDGVAQGLDVKDSVKCATTANITLSGEQTIDGVTTSASRVLVKDQTASEENGIYVSAAGAWSRSSDTDTFAELVSAFTFVEEGTVNADTGWVSTADEGGTLDTTSVPFSQFGSATSYTADGSGIELSGTVFSIELDGGKITKSASGLTLDESAIDHDALSNFVAKEHIDWTADAGADNLHDNNVTEANVTQHEAALSITESQISDLGGTVLLNTTDTFTGVLTVTGSTAIDNITVDGNAITSTDTDGDITLTPNGTGSVVIDGISHPQADGTNGQVLTTNGSGVLSFTTVSGGSGGVTWEVKSANYTASADDHLLTDTSSGAITITLPTGGVGDQVVVLDGSGDAATNAVTVAPASGEKLLGVTDDTYSLDQDDATVEFIYMSASRGWVVR